jgi:hypothetical protein
MQRSAINFSVMYLGLLRHIMHSSRLMHVYVRNALAAGGRQMT